VADGAPTCIGGQDCPVPDHATILNAAGTFHGGPVEAMGAALRAHQAMNAEAPRG